MCNRVYWAVIALSLVQSAGLGAQSLQTRPDSTTAETVVFLGHSLSARGADMNLYPAARAGAVGLTAGGDPRSKRKQFVAVGAAIGMIAGAALAIHDSRDGFLGYGGAVVLLPLGVIAGGAVGGFAGYVVSFAIYPP